MAEFRCQGVSENPDGVGNDPDLAAGLMVPLDADLLQSIAQALDDVEDLDIEPKTGTDDLFEYCFGAVAAEHLEATLGVVGQGNTAQS